VSSFIPSRVRILAALLGASLAVAPLAAQATPSLLIDVDSGKVLIADDATKPWYPASVTKLMTAYVTFRALRDGRITPQTLLTVSSNAVAQAPSKMGFKAGTQITVDNALKMMLVKSANDIAVVIAEGVGGSLPQFVDEMNAKAAELGMTGSHFDNPNGLPDPDNYTTARDLAVLARAILLQFPEQADLFKMPAIQLGNRVIKTYNKLIDRYPGAEGMKTGFICASGFNLVGVAHRGNKRVLAVVLGTSSGRERTEAAALLMEKGFQQSWSIFGSVSPTVDSLKNEGGTPTDMRAQVCGPKRKTVASEDDDGDASPNGFAAAGMTGGVKMTGASLLVNLPPSMAPVPVWVGPTPSQAAIDAAYPPAPEKKSRKAASKKGGDKKDAAKQDATKQDAAKPDTAKKDASKKKPDATAEAAPATTPAAKPATKPAAKPAPKPAASGAPVPAPRPAN
jgi:D-alanyl-D-alanine carboxypeptidase